LLRHLGLNRRATAPPSHLDALPVLRGVLAVARARRWRAWQKEKVREIRGNELILWKKCGSSVDFVLFGHTAYRCAAFAHRTPPLFLQAALLKFQCVIVALITHDTYDTQRRSA
ncbi:MAG: hypothetical protein OXD38_14850, partial [Aestuariivita sp.]|nr:hypothetical protein [Aestuariivita sp.]